MPKEELQARRFMVTGRVHGVGFRNYAEYAAGRIGVQGYVRNREDGSVEVLAMGNPEQLGQMKAALEKGPAMARVDRVEEQPDQVDRRYLGQFCIEYTI
jgi:acylphosphatase